jgi:hypothetical protein
MRDAVMGILLMQDHKLEKQSAFSETLAEMGRRLGDGAENYVRAQSIAIAVALAQVAAKKAVAKSHGEPPKARVTTSRKAK